MSRMSFCLAVLLLLPVRGGAQPSTAGTRDTIGDVIGLVSRDSLRASVAALQAFGTRLWSNANRKSVALWIGGEMRRAGLEEVVLDSFQTSGTWQYNVVGTLPGVTAPDSQIILGGHTDSYSSAPGRAPGADDNASGTAAVLEAARVLCRAAYRPHATFRFIGFSAEEIGLRGSAVYAARAKDEGQTICAMLNFDMIAHRNASSSLREFSVVWYMGAEWLARLDSLMARTYTSLVPILSTSARSGSDSYSFWANGFPAIFHYERGSNPTYHTELDVIDSLDLSYAEEITRTGLAAALAVDGKIAAIVNPPHAPETFALFQNFPNPFNPGTVITYHVPESRLVSLIVYDVLGREVARLVHEWKAPGSYTVPFDGKGLASGVYLYRLQASPAVLTRRMVLVR